MEPEERISSFEIEPAADSGGESPTRPFWTRPEYQPTEEIRRSWMRRPTPEPMKIKYDKIFLWTGGLILTTILVAGLTILVGGKKAPSHYHLLPEDSYTVALRKALTFFNAQRSGKLPEHNNVSWRGDSCLNDGTAIQDLVGGFYDAGHAIKFNFPASFAMTMLSWSVLEYSAKYEAAGELNHVKEIIKWGNDYLLKTFNNSADKIDRIASQVGVGSSRASTYNDIYCWMRPEDIDYPRPVSECQKCSDLAAEMAAALAAASIVFSDDAAYSQQLVHGARILFEFSRDQLGIYSNGESDAATIYNSSGFWDEIIWGGAWMYYATGNDSYLEIATDPELAKLAGAGQRGPHFGVLNWDNKLVGAQVLLTRLRMFLSPGYPYEEVLKTFHAETIATMCAYLPYFSSFNRTRGGLIVLNDGAPKSLQHVVSAAFLATLYSDYLAASESGGWDCGATFYMSDVLRNFSMTQVQYILGKNPRNLSYVVGYGDHYMEHFSHRGASIPNDGLKYTCKSGWKWRDSLKPNPNVISGAMVGGPDQHDEFNDTRINYTEPTLAGNAGLVAALVGLSGDKKTGINKNLIFSQIPSLFPKAPPPPAPWKP